MSGYSEMASFQTSLLRFHSSRLPSEFAYLAFRSNFRLFPRLLAYESVTVCF